MFGFSSIRHTGEIILRQFWSQICLLNFSQGLCWVWIYFWQIAAAEGSVGRELPCPPCNVKGVVIAHYWQWGHRYGLSTGYKPHHSPWRQFSLMLKVDIFNFHERFVWRRLLDRLVVVHFDYLKDNILFLKENPNTQGTTKEFSLSMIYFYASKQKCNTASAARWYGAWGMSSAWGNTVVNNYTVKVQSIVKKWIINCLC